MQCKIKIYWLKEKLLALFTLQFHNFFLGWDQSFSYSKPLGVSFRLNFGDVAIDVNTKEEFWKFWSLLNRCILLILYGNEFKNLYFNVKITLLYFHVSFITKAWFVYLQKLRSNMEIHVSQWEFEIWLNIYGHWLYCTCSSCGWGSFGHFVSHLFFHFPYRLKYCLKGPWNPNRPTNQ